MTTQEQIKNDYAVSMTFKDWSDLLNYFINEDSKFSISTIIRHENEVMKTYAMECLKLASVNVICNENYININGIEVLNEFTVKQSITNENNIIK